ncbi:type 1 fimbrial protein [Citrobacter koseri]|uniref:fimbrial protein n=1 Tax=Citrobacter koseri TaxID=545 RepID=UPI001905AFD5|nr:fimbrial protein [Citrobacter koseri]MBJ9122320.1 type 1 fimbrial protein [Citrobacter koseri]MBJ9245692.1 type 1 fimbrial protein [Citrobacter koseri]
MQVILRRKLLAIPGLVIFIFSFSLWASTQPKGNFTISTRVVSRTCEFNDALQTIILDDISTSAFKDSSIKAVQQFTVNITCGTGVSSVNIVVSGSADTSDTTLFKNTAQNPSGNTTGVGLRVFDNDNVIRPDGLTPVLIVPVNQTGSHTFKAGYVATRPGNVTPGAFATSLTLQFDYL